MNVKQLSKDTVFAQLAGGFQVFAPDPSAEKPLIQRPARRLKVPRLVVACSNMTSVINYDNLVT